MVPKKLAAAALAALAVTGAVVCALLIINAPTPGPVELAGSEYFDALETSGPFHNSYIKAPSMQQLAGHDHDPNDNSLRLHLLAKFVQKKLETDPPKKTELNGLWQRLAYARKVLGSDATEILGPKKRDSQGNILKRHQEEERANQDSFEDHLKQTSSRVRELNRLRRLLKSKYHLSNKQQALAIAEKDSGSAAGRRRGAYPSSTAAGAIEEETEAAPKPHRVYELHHSVHSKAIHHFVRDDSSQKLVIEGGIHSAGPVAVVGWLHKDKDGDWAGKLFPKNSAQGLAAIQSPKAGSKGWFDGTIRSVQLPQTPQEQPMQVTEPSVLPAEPVTYNSELSQPLYDVVPEEYSQASLDPQINTPVNSFEVEPRFTVE